uniref:EamA domain-containing protein n=1 Tax=Branchiostoma floridae TaxID=7739 RepID=C3YSS8_BRAFL|eukprot:XP_002600767.1 hypothetical protein BRAFLDRAFT_83510 [Branchiostoma floridae]
MELKPSVAACIGGTFCTTGVVLVAIGSWKNIGTSRGNSAPITGNLGTSRDISAPISGNISTSRDNSEPIIGVSLAILSALIESLLNVQVRILLRDCPIVMVLFYTFAVSFAIGTVPMLIMRPQWSMDVHITTLLVLCAGLYAVTSFIYVKAAKTVPPVTQVVLSQLELGVTFLLQFAFLRFVPNVFEIGGASVIAVGGLVDTVYIVRVDSRNRKKLNFRKQLGFNVDSDNAKSHTVDWKDRLREGNRQK